MNRSNDRIVRVHVGSLKMHEHNATIRVENNQKEGGLVMRIHRHEIGGKKEMNG